MKTFVLTVSKTFPTKHKRAGENTMFVENIKKLFSNESEKIHTIRGNYELWEKRINQINKGEAVLSIRYWSGKPYNSKQVEICKLERVGIQKIKFYREFFSTNWVVGQSEFSDQGLRLIAQNDGLSLDDFKEWFKGYDFLKPMAIIHFTDFKY